MLRLHKLDNRDDDRLASTSFAGRGFGAGYYSDEYIGLIDDEETFAETTVAEIVHRAVRIGSDLIKENITAHVDKNRYFVGLGTYHALDMDNFVLPKFTCDAPQVKGFIYSGSFSLPRQKRARSRFFDSITQRLERLKDGWDGEGSVAPSRSVIDDISKAAVAFQAITLAPEVEVDEDGKVTCAWQKGAARFALTFAGKGRVVGTFAPWADDYPPWRLNVTEEAELAARLESERVAILVGAR